MSDVSKRAHERTTVNWISMIRLQDGSEIPCTVKDVSATGMRLAIPEQIPLPSVFIVKVLGRDLVFQVQQAWRRQHYTGVSILKIGKVPKPHSAVDDGGTGDDAAQRYRRLGDRQSYHSRRT